MLGQLCDALDPSSGRSCCGYFPFPFHAHADSDSVHQGVSIHTCFSTIDVLLNQDVANILEQDIPEDPSVTTLFDCYIHTILSGGADTYTML